jgi:WD40 repeat protein
MAFSPDGNFLLTGARGGGAHLFDRQSMKILASRDDDRKIWSVAFHPDNRHFVTADQHFKATLWSIAYEPVQEFIGHQSIVFAVAISPDGQWVLTGSRDKTVRLWDIRGREHLQIPVGNRSVWSTHSLAFAPDSNSFVTTNLDDTAVWYDLSGQQIADLPVGGGCNAVAFSPDGTLIATGGWNGMIRLWSTQSLQENELNVDAFLKQFIYDFTEKELTQSGVFMESDKISD